LTRFRHKSTACGLVTLLFITATTCAQKCNITVGYFKAPFSTFVAMPSSGLPDISWYRISKPEVKCTKSTQNVPNGHKISQVSVNIPIGHKIFQHFPI
jgi:hypothetical protein